MLAGDDDVGTLIYSLLKAILSKISQPLKANTIDFEQCPKIAYNL
jgi:hypothetical protein